MIGLHSTHLKKVYSDNLETNALQPINLVASEVLQPVINMTSDLNIVRSAQNGTIYATPADKYFYLTNISLTAWSDASSPSNGEISISFTTAEGNAVTFAIKTDLSNGVSTSNNNTVFPLKGIKIAKSSNITLTSNGNSYCLIAGYLGSDRN